MERVDLAHVYGTDRQRAWRTAGPYWQERRVEFGRLGDGRWYANDSRDPGGAYVFDADELGEQLALRFAYRRMRQEGGDWLPTPAAYDGHGNPTDGLPWKASGRHWYLAE